MIDSITNVDYLKNKLKDKFSYKLFKKPYNKLNDHEQNEVLIQLNALKRCHHGNNENICSLCEVGDF